MSVYRAPCTNDDDTCTDEAGVFSDITIRDQKFPSPWEIVAETPANERTPQGPKREIAPMTKAPHTLLKGHDKYNAAMGLSLGGSNVLTYRLHHII